MPSWTRLPAAATPGHPGRLGPARSAGGAPASNPGPRLSAPARPRPRPPTPRPRPAPQPRPRKPPGPARKGAAHLPTAQALTARSLPSSSHLTARQPQAGSSVDAHTLSLRRSSSAGSLGRPWGGRRSRARAGAEASGTAATSTGSVSRQGVSASGHATMAPPTNRMGPTPHGPGAEPKTPAWAEGRGLGLGLGPG